MNHNKAYDLSREELYERVWSKPTVQVAAELGISDVALGKRCKSMNVPKPPLGYWAKVAAGQKPRKVPLPAEPEPQQFLPLDAPVPGTLALPHDKQALHAFAEELRPALRFGVPGEDGRIKLEGHNFPLVIVSKSLIDRTAKALHVILTITEARDIPMRRRRSKYDVAHFERGADRLNLTIEETLVERELSKAERNRMTWQIGRPMTASGKLIVSISTERYGFSRTAKKWTESDSLPLEELLSKAARAICAHYAKLEAEHLAAMERRRVEHERWLVEEKARKVREHKIKLAAMAQTRRENLLKAAEWWRLHREAVAFINECEHRWRGDPSGDLTMEQQSWLVWARESAAALSPFETGYPNTDVDGAFNAESVPFGGPYPQRPELPTPPTMPEIPPPQNERSHSYQAPMFSKPEFPFWLKHQR